MSRTFWPIPDRFTPPPIPTMNTTVGHTGS